MLTTLAVVGLGVLFTWAITSIVLERLDKCPRTSILRFETWTNLAYAAVGLFVLATVGTLASAVFCLTMVYLAFGSALYHSEAAWIKKYSDLDVSAMYAVFGGLVWFTDARLLGFGPWATAVGMLIVAAAAAYWLRYRL
jgi:hypothetical protein